MLRQRRRSSSLRRKLRGKPGSKSSSARERGEVRHRVPLWRRALENLGVGRAVLQTGLRIIEIERFDSGEGLPPYVESYEESRLGK